MVWSSPGTVTGWFGLLLELFKVNAISKKFSTSSCVQKQESENSGVLGSWIACIFHKDPDLHHLVVTEPTKIFGG